MVRDMVRVGKAAGGSVGLHQQAVPDAWARPWPLLLMHSPASQRHILTERSWGADR